MITIKNEKQMKKYYVKKVQTYVFKDDVEFLFDVNVEAHIKAFDIKALNIMACDIKADNINAFNINAGDINAENIYAWNIKSWNIKANYINAFDINADDIITGNIDADNISYYAICSAYDSIHCNSIEGRHPYSKHLVLSGKLIIKGDEK